MALSQVLAPQLQQSLALLQAPTLELKALVEHELQQNPALEEIPEFEYEQQTKPKEERDAGPDYSDPTEPPKDVTYDPATEKESKEPVDDFQKEFEKLTKLDEEWRDHFAQTRLPSRVSQEDEERRQHMFDSLVAETSLQEFLLEQLRLSEVEGAQRSIAEMIIGNVDDYGYLQASIDELAVATNIPSEELGTVLDVIQSFHPPGVGARNLRECLMLQLERAEQTKSLEYRIVRDEMDALGKRRIPDIARRLGVSADEVQQALGRIACLDPRPGRAFMPDSQQFIVPEVFVTWMDGEWQITTNNDNIPHLRISNTYKDLMAKGDCDGDTRDYIREKIRAGKFVIKSIHQRQETILNIAREIVKRQEAFLWEGVTALRPMTMVQVAEVVGVHETTVSRAVSGKYIETPQGIFEMKYFFTSGISTEGGESMSNTSVKEIISELVRNEPPNSPYSDEKLVEILQEKGIKIARRTVAKYRGELNILPSNMRKVF